MLSSYYSVSLAHSVEKIVSAVYFLKKSFFGIFFLHFFYFAMNSKVVQFPIQANF